MSLLESLRDHTHVVISGSGTRAAFLYGLFEYLTNLTQWESIFPTIRGAAGVSSGCLIALALLTGADFVAICDAVTELTKRHASIAPSLDIHLAVDAFGLDDGSVLLDTIDTLMCVMGLSASTTFGSLHRLTQKDYRICATNVHSMTPMYFSHATTPQMTIRDAIYMSMTLPFVFKPRRWMGELYVDGGVLENFPTDIFGSDVVPLVIHMAWAHSGTPTSLRGFACSMATATLYVQYKQLQIWKESHPLSVWGIDDGGIGDALSLDSDPEYIARMRRRGHIRGMLSERWDLNRFVKWIMFLSLVQNDVQMEDRCGLDDCENDGRAVTAPHDDDDQKRLSTGHECDDD